MYVYSAEIVPVVTDQKIHSDTQIINHEEILFFYCTVPFLIIILK